MPNKLCLAIALIVSNLSHAATFTVNKTADSNDGLCDSDCSLREAITAANSLPGSDAVHFALAGTGPFVLTPTSPLPPLLDSVAIDGYTQAGSSANTHIATALSNAVLKIELRGNGSAAVGLGTCAPNIVLRGLSITGFDTAISTLSSGPTSCIQARDQLRIEGNFIGIQADGFTSRGNGDGIVVNGAMVVIGGVLPAMRNIISCNTRRGILFEGEAAGSVVLGNIIGVGARSSGADCGNTVAGIRVDGSRDITIGSLDAPNRFAFNGTGVHITSAAQRVDMANNQFAQNDALGIDLSVATVPNGVTPNDLDDADFGSNAAQNFPEIIRAERNAAGLLRVQGFLDVPVAAQNLPYRIAVYASPTCDSSGFGEGEQLLAAANLNFTQGTGESFEILIDAPSLANGSFITTTATGPAGTSEFSACARVIDEVVFRDGFEAM